MIYFYSNSKGFALRRKKLRIGLIIFIATVTVLFTGLTIYLSFSANKLKALLEEEFSYQLELNCEIRGDIKVRIIPGIKIKIYDVVFDNGQEDILSGEQVNITIPFSFLFNEKVEINELELIRPKFHVWYDEGGKSSWALIGLDETAGQADTNEFHYYIDLRRITVKQGLIHFTDKANGDTIVLGDIYITSDTMQFTGSQEGIDWGNSRFMGSLRAGHFRLNNFRFHNMSFFIKGQNQLINIYYASEEELQREDEGNIFLDIGSSPVHVTINHKMTGFRIEKLLKNLEMDTLFSGIMNFESSLSFNTGHDMFSTFNGFINLEGYDLILYGYNIDNFLNKFEKSQRFTLIDIGALFVAGPVGPVVTKGYDFARLMVPSKQDTSYITGFKSYWEITNGVANASDVAFATLKNRLAAKGEIDFAHSEFNDFTFAVLNEYGCASISQKVNGSFADPKSKGVSKVGALLGPVKNFFKGIFKKKENCPRFYEGAIQHPEN